MFWLCEQREAISGTQCSLFYRCVAPCEIVYVVVDLTVYYLRKNELYIPQQRLWGRNASGSNQNIVHVTWEVDVPSVGA